MRFFPLHHCYRTQKKMLKLCEGGQSNLIGFFAKFWYMLFGFFYVTSHTKYSSVIQLGFFKLTIHHSTWMHSHPHTTSPHSQLCVNPADWVKTKHNSLYISAEEIMAFWVLQVPTHTYVLVCLDNKLSGVRDGWL